MFARQQPIISAILGGVLLFAVMLFGSLAMSVAIKAATRGTVAIAVRGALTTNGAPSAVRAPGSDGAYAGPSDSDAGLGSPVAAEGFMYDSKLNRLVVVGSYGQGSNCSGTYVDDAPGVWRRFDIADPDLAADSEGAYDSARERVVMSGGSDLQGTQR